jgi:pilus assembly protein CpaB
VKSARAFLVALTVALIATFAQCRFVAMREKALLYDSEPIKTLVAIKDIAPNTRVDETMVQSQEVPRKWRQPKALGSIDEIVGQFAQVKINTGEQVVATKLKGATEAGLAFYVPKGMRAISIAADVYNAVGGHVRPGDYVDVLGTFDFGQGEKSDLRTVTVMQRVWVLAVVDELPGSTARAVPEPTREGEAPEPEPGPQERISSRATVTLALAPPDAQKIVMAQELGRLTISLRSLWEGETTVPMEPATVSNTLGIPEQVRYRSRPSYRVIEGGGG